MISKKDEREGERERAQTTVSYDFPSNEWNTKRSDAAARITKNYRAGQYRNITKKRNEKYLQNSIETLSNCSKNHTTALQTLGTRQNGSTVNKNEGVKLSSHEF